jgi:hypothetical protein
MVYPGTLFIGDSGVFLCIPMKIGVKSEHCGGRLMCVSPPPEIHRVDPESGSTLRLL